MWSLIAAAFIGPGTVATATRAGVEGEVLYLPVILLAAVAGYIFMEMAARITLVSGQSLGSLLRRSNRILPFVLFLAVLFGCMAYQAGNLLGALGGLQLLFPAAKWWLPVLVGGITGLMWSGNTQRIARVMAVVVFAMGLLFVAATFRILFFEPPTTQGAEIDSSLLIGLIGTTIVPYNFFLAAGLGAGSSLADMRRGLFLSFAVGAIITAAILVVGSTSATFTSFGDLSRSVSDLLGAFGGVVLGVGLFAAGFSSATTAPLAAAIAGRELIGGEKEEWENTGKWFRASWIAVLLTGLGVALLQLDILGVIVAAQIVNGLLLPLIALVVFIIANRRSIVSEHTNSHWQNLAGALVLLFIFYKNGQFLLGLL